MVVFGHDNCCFPYLLVTKSTYICTSWSSVIHFRHARRCKREPPSMTKRTCCGNCISRCLDSDYMLSENSPLFFMDRTLYAFVEVHGPSSSESIYFLSTSFFKSTMVTCSLSVSSGIGLHAKTQPNILDFLVFRCICFFYDKQFGYLEVCMEIRVAHIVIDSIMCKIVLHTF